MRRTSPARASDAGGFTLIEMVVGLALLGLIAAATSRALLASLMAEDAARRLRDSDLLLDRVACHRLLNLAPTGCVDAAVWTFEESRVETGASTQRVAWTGASLKSVDRPSFRNRMFRRER